MLLQLRKAMQHTAREKLPCMQFRKQQNICVEISFQIRIQIHKIGVGKKKKLDKQKQNIIMLSKKYGGMVGIKNTI